MSVRRLGLPISSLETAAVEVLSEIITPFPELRVVILMKPFDRLVFRAFENKTIIWERLSTRVVGAGGRFILQFNWEDGAGSVSINGYPALIGDAALDPIDIGAFNPPNWTSVWEKESKEKRHLRVKVSLRRHEQPEKDPYSVKKSRMDLIRELRDYNAILSDGIDNISVGRLHSWRSLAQTVRALIADYGPKSTSQPFLPYVAGLWDLPLNIYCTGLPEKESLPLLENLSYIFTNDLISAFPSKSRPSEIDLQVWLELNCAILPRAGTQAEGGKFMTYTNNKFIREIADSEAAHGATSAFSIGNLLRAKPIHDANSKFDRFTIWLVAVSEAVQHLGCRVADEAEARLLQEVKTSA